MSDATLDQSYNRIAAKWQAKLEYLGFPDAYTRLATSLPLPGPAPLRVLDVGCGTGDLALAFLRTHGRNHSVTLLDPAADMLDFAVAALRETGVTPNPVSGRLGDPTGGPFDVVLCAHVVEHMSEIADALRLLRREVRDGGSLLLVVSKPHWCSRLVWLRWRHATHRPEAVLAALEATGFGAVEMRPLGSGPPGRVSMGYLVRA